MSKTAQPKPDISNRTLLTDFIANNAITLTIGLFVGGMAWANVTANQDTAQKERIEAKSERDALKKKTESIEKALVKFDKKQLEHDIYLKTIKATVKEQKEDLKAIRKLLEKQNNG